MALTLNEASEKSRQKIEKSNVSEEQSVILNLLGMLKEVLAEQKELKKMSTHRPWQSADTQRDCPTKDRRTGSEKIAKASLGYVQNTLPTMIKETKAWVDAVSIFPKLTVPMPKFLSHKERK